MYTKERVEFCGNEMASNFTWNDQFCVLQNWCTKSGNIGDIRRCCHLHLKKDNQSFNVWLVLNSSTCNRLFRYIYFKENLLPCSCKKKSKTLWSIKWILLLCFIYFFKFVSFVINIIHFVVLIPIDFFFSDIKYCLFNMHILL